MKSQNCLLSFIIPLWNRENTICYCLDSILCQALVCFFEIIVIDDGSFDSSCSIIEELKGEKSMKRLKDSILSDRFPETTRLFQTMSIDQEMEVRSRIKLLKNEVNQGAAIARNRGLDIATGEYVWFVDSDDFIASGSLEVLKRTISQKKRDILCFSTRKFSDIPPAYVISSDSYGAEELNVHNINDILFMLRSGTVWSRLFYGEFIRRYRFNSEYTYSEDSQLVWNVTLKARDAAYLKEPLYGYMNNSNSLTSVKPFDRFKCYVQVVEEYLSAIGMANMSTSDKGKLVKECEKRLYFHAFYTYENNEITDEMWDKWYEVYYRCMVDNPMRNFLKRLVSLFIWCFHSNRLVLRLFNLMKKGKNVCFK